MVITVFFKQKNPAEHKIIPLGYAWKKLKLKLLLKSLHY